MKPVLITFQKSTSLLKVKKLQRAVDYKKIYVFTMGTGLEKRVPNVEIVPVTKLTEIPAHIDQIYQKEGNKSFLFPYFAGDNKSPLNLKIYNKTFGTKINPHVFRLKNKMNQFLGEDLTAKKNLKIKYKDLKKSTFAEATSQISPPFIIKPTNASSSTQSFMVGNEVEFESIKQEVKSKYDFVIEEYIGGNLYSVDFFCDGKDVFMLCLCREMNYGECIEKFSKKYHQKYEHIYEKYLHFLPFRYTVDFKKLTDIELKFIKNIGDKLAQANYRGFIHLEYKVDKKAKKIGFIEWGARLGWKRGLFMKEMYHLEARNLPIELIYKKDRSRFELKKGLYFPKHRDMEKNFFGIKTAVLEKTPLIKIIRKTGNFLEISFFDSLKNFLQNKYKIKVKEVYYTLNTSVDFCLYPFFQRGDTRFDYIFEVNHNSYEAVLKHKTKLIENLVFQDYGNIKVSQRSQEDEDDTN